MREPRSLLVYQKALAFAVLVHAICGRISRRRYPGLADQLVRASHSVAANIAEGCAHSSRREFARFLQLALASCGEVALHLVFARHTRAISLELFVELDSANREVRRMLASLLRVVRDELTDDDDDPSVAAMHSRRVSKPSKRAPASTDDEPRN